ncbi:unnamed protein product [Lampetra fluviatilis]
MEPGQGKPPLHLTALHNLHGKFPERRHHRQRHCRHHSSTAADATLGSPGSRWAVHAHAGIRNENNAGAAVANNRRRSRPSHGAQANKTEDRRACRSQQAPSLLARDGRRPL